MRTIEGWTQKILPVRIIDMRPKERLPRKKKKKDLRKQASKKLRHGVVFDAMKYAIVFDGKGNQIITR